ncbi:hypothetical protein niasHS_001946 [Heterodera schachtii]|uniref:Uncharacterized protein n=1 Tax=Heterodera schachtii TaxID=97005 RepID=A0ABD2KAR7_HETSC
MFGKPTNLRRFHNKLDNNSADPVSKQLLQICVALLQASSKTAGLHLRAGPRTPTLPTTENDGGGHQDHERRRSVVVQGMPEPVGDKPSERVAADRTELSHVLDELGVECPLISYRMGPPYQAGSGHRPRLIKVILPASKFQRQLLAEWNKKRTQLKQNGKWNTVNIRPSLSPAELEERKAMQKECTEKRKAEPNADWIIYAGSIVKRSEVPNFRKNN